MTPTLKRIIAVVLILVVLGGIPWFLLRDTYDKKIRRWREATAVLFSQIEDLERAEEVNKRVLELIPESTYDLVMRAQILEHQNTQKGLEEALAIYSSVLESGATDTLPINLHRARVARRLHRFGEARAYAQSIVDVLPLEATIELGIIATDSLDPTRAVALYQRALQTYARTLPEKIWVHTAIAIAQSSQDRLCRGTNRPDSLDCPEDPDQLAASARASLDKARELIESDALKEFATDEQRRWWLARMIERRALIRADDEDPAADGLGELLRVDEPPPKALASVLGRLALLAADAANQRGDTRGEEKWLSDADEFFLVALDSLLPEEAVSRVEASLDRTKTENFDHEEIETRRYLLDLVEIAKAYLRSSQFARLHEPGGTLQLAQRVADGVDLPESDLSWTFQALRGFSFLKSGDTETALPLLDAALRDREPSERMAHALSFAQSTLDLRPGDPSAFHFFDVSLDSGPILAELASKARFLVKARQSQSLEAEAKSRLDVLLSEASANTKTASEHLVVAGIVKAVSGRAPAVESLRQGRQRFPASREIRRQIAQTFLEIVSKDGADQDDAVESALTEFLGLFLEQPAADPQSLRVLQQLTRHYMRQNEGAAFDRFVEPLFPNSNKKELHQFSSALKSLLLGDYAAALRDSGSIQSDFGGFVAFLRGTSELEQASRLASDSAEHKQKLVRAKQEYRRSPDFPANQLELLNIRLRELTPEDDVPEELITEIEGMVKDERYHHQPLWILFQAHRHRYFYRRAQDLPEQDILRQQILLNQTLRRVIQTEWTFLPAYLALAETIVLPTKLGEPTSKEQFLAAVDLLRAAPRVSGEGHAAMVRFLQAAGEHIAARELLLALGCTHPRSTTLWPLLSSLADERQGADGIERVKRFVETQETSGSAWAEVLDRVLESPALSPDQRLAWIAQQWQIAKSRNRVAELEEALYPAVRQRLGTVTAFEGLCHLFLGDRSSRLSETTLSRFTRQEYRLRSVEHYRKALAAYKRDQIEPPLGLLNNLAWGLVESVDEADRERGLELARDALEAATEDVPGNGDRQNLVRDTYGWALFRNGRKIEAKEIYAQLVESSRKPDYLYRFAVVLHSLEDHELARSTLEEALKSLKFSTRSEADDLLMKVKSAIRQASEGADRSSGRRPDSASATS